MAVIIKELAIESFRGLQELTIKNLNHVNIIVGDNNSGKTSVLESLLLLRNPSNITNIILIAMERELSMFRTSLYEGFINLFAKNQDHLKLAVNAKLNGENLVEVNLTGVEKLTILDETEKNRVQAQNRFLRAKTIQEDLEVMAFDGVLSSSVSGNNRTAHIFFHDLTRFTGMEIPKGDCLRMEYLSPFDHVMGRSASRIISNDKYKDLCIDILQIFDKDILDIFILRNEQRNRPVEYIKHRTLGNMPLSTYGDGIKKVLSMANAIAKSADGILLIDEVETALHSKYYEKIFSFLILASKRFNVQLFITTHSIEAIDGLLATQNYDDQNVNDDISVITLKKTDNKTYSRVLPGRQVRKNRENFGFEVRI